MANGIAPPIVIVGEFFLPQDPSWDFYGKGGIEDYLLNPELHKYEDENGFVPKSISETMYERYMQRTGEFAHKDFQHHLKMFDKSGMDVSDKTKRQHAHKKSNIWSFVVSLREDVCLENDLSTIADKAGKLLFHQIGVEMKKYGFDEKYFQYHLSVHKNSDNHHLHLIMFQPDTTPQENLLVRGKIPEVAFAATKVMLSKELEGFLSNTVDIGGETQKYKTVWAQFIKNLSGGVDTPARVFDVPEREKVRKLANLQAGVYDLFRHQTTAVKYYDKKSKQWKEKHGEWLVYENLTKPMHSLEQLAVFKEHPEYLKITDPKRLKDLGLEKKVQPAQNALKSALDKYIVDVLHRDMAVNAGNKAYTQQADEFYKSLNEKLNPNDKDKDIKPYLEQQKQKRYGEMHQNIGNMLIKDLASFNKMAVTKNSSDEAKSKNEAFERKKSSRTQNRVAGGFAKKVQQKIHDEFKKINHTAGFKLIGFTDDKTLIKEMDKIKQQGELERIAFEAGMTVEELKRIIKSGKTIGR